MLVQSIFYLHVILNVVSAFTPLPSASIRPSLSKLYSSMTPPTPIDKVLILKDADAVGKRIREIVDNAAEEAIQKRGKFALAIPGGSILKMLSGDIPQKEAWTSKTSLVYVNHKCVPMDDEQLATHAKACKLFLNDWNGVNCILLDGTSDGETEAQSYEDKMRELDSVSLPRCEDTGLPVFDLALIGVGDDGHVGSLYPSRDEVLVGADGPWVLPVTMKNPPSITLSLPVMANAKQVVVAACGVSEKYPQGKSEGMRRAIAEENESLTSFPAVGLRQCATWIMDEPAASALGDKYLK